MGDEQGPKEDARIKGLDSMSFYTKQCKQIDPIKYKNKERRLRMTGTATNQEEKEKENKQIERTQHDYINANPPKSKKASSSDILRTTSASTINRLCPAPSPCTPFSTSTAEDAERYVAEVFPPVKEA